MTVARNVVALVGLVGLVAACSRKRESAPAGTQELEPRGRECTQAVGYLRDWLGELIADGSQAIPVAESLELAVTEEAPSQVMMAPVVTIDEVISFKGQLVTVPDLRSQLQDVRANGGSSLLLVVADRDTPWSAIAGVAQAAAGAGYERIGFVLTSVNSRAADPPPTVNTGNLFGRCAPATALMGRLGKLESGDKSAILAAEMPDAIEACDCAVELPAVWRWLWGMWGREATDMPHYTAIVALGRDGKVEARGSAPWSMVSVPVVDAAKAGTPTTFGITP